MVNSVFQPDQGLPGSMRRWRGGGKGCYGVISSSEGARGMPQARHHYMVDFFYPEAGRVDGFRKESEQIVAYNDAEAIRESHPLGKEPSFYQVRKVTRTSNVVIYDSRQGPQEAR